MSYLTLGALGDDPCGSHVEAEIRALDTIKAIQQNIDAVKKAGSSPAAMSSLDASMASAQGYYSKVKADRERCRSTVQQPTKQLVGQSPVNLAPRADAHDPYVNFEARKLANAAAENVNAFYKELQGIKVALDAASSAAEVEKYWQAALAESRAFASGPQTSATKQRGEELVRWIRSAKDAALQRVSAQAVVSRPQARTLTPQEQVAAARAKAFITSNPIQNAPENTGAVSEREFDRMLAMAMLRTQEQQPQQGSALNTAAGVVLAGAAAFAILALAVKGLGK